MEILTSIATFFIILYVIKKNLNFLKNLINQEKSDFEIGFLIEKLSQLKKKQISYMEKSKILNKKLEDYENAIENIKN